MIYPKQGDVYLAHLNPVKGHEQGGTRPVLVMQNNDLNELLSTVVIVPLTSNTKAAGKLTTYFLPTNLSKLEKDSVALLFQIRTIDKSRLIKKIATLSPKDFQEVLSQLKFVF